jgi:DNA-binding NtrC family response regulator
MTARARTESTPPPGLTAIFIGRSDPSSPVRALVDRLASAGVATSIVDRIDEAAAIVQRLGGPPPCVVLDALALDLVGGNDEGETLAAVVAAAAQLAPGVEPLVVTSGLRADEAIACFRAGAGDVLDLTLEGIAAGRPAVARIARRQAAARARDEVERDLRAMVEEFLRDLILTERRSIDLEEQLHRRRRTPTGEFVAAVDGERSRAAAVVLVESDAALARQLTGELERVGLQVHAFASGEAAVADAASLAGREAFVDLALVSVRLPGQDGLATVRALRAAYPGLPAFLMTDDDAPALAAGAADLGVVGYVYKPFRDLPIMIGRIKGLAEEAMDRGRERRYLRQIKARHEGVLSRYKALSGG